MSEKQYRDKITNIRNNQAKIESDLGRARQAATKNRADARSSRARITERTSPSSARSYENSAASAERRAEAEDAKVANLSKKLASLAKALADAETALEREIKSTAGRRQREEAAAMQKRRYEDDRRRAEELEHARAVGQLSRSIVHVVHAPVPPNEKMRVLILTANPVDAAAQSPATTTLWVEREIRDAQRAIERAKHRDRLEIVIRPAAQRDDLLDQLNLHTPHLLHYSGHGSDVGIYFETDNRERDELLTGELLARAIGALDSPPRVVVLNACDTEITGKMLAGHGVEAVISMRQPISDTAARIFAEQFYSAIASGQSLSSAFDQAIVKLAFANLGEEDTPVLSCATGVDPHRLVLVEP